MLVLRRLLMPLKVSLPCAIPLIPMMLLILRDESIVELIRMLPTTSNCHLLLYLIEPTTDAIQPNMQARKHITDHITQLRHRCMQDCIRRSPRWWYLRIMHARRLQVWRTVVLRRHLRGWCQRRTFH